MGLLAKVAGKGAVLSLDSINRIKEFGGNNDVIQGVIFIAQRAENAGALGEELSGMMVHVGTVVVLPYDRFLVLLPKAVDWDLIVHRISMSLPLKALVRFVSHNSEEAINRVQAYD
jgi:hypothetical protein